MTKRLLLTIALGSAVAVIAAGMATSATVDHGGGVNVQKPTGGALPECADERGGSHRNLPQDERRRRGRRQGTIAQYQ
jgi:hypothetical protein